MTFETTRSDAKLFPGETAVDILLSLDTKKRGHDDIGKPYQEDVKKYCTLTELHRCVRSDDAEKAIELVLNDGADINILALCNRTPLPWVSASSSSMLIKTLIDLGADVNAQRTDDKVAPLNLAASWNNYMATRLLLEHGADENMQSSCGWSPLHASVKQGFFEVSQLLIGVGCNINLRNEIHQNSYFCIFQNSLWLLSHHAKFQLITTTGSRFFRTVSVEILRPPLLALVPEAGLRISGSDVRGSPQT